MGFASELEKIAFDSHKFREGMMDEGIPLSGAVLGAGIGQAFYKKPLVGAALGYALGGGASILRSKLKGEEPSPTRKILAGGALGFGLGGLAHAGVGMIAKGRPAAGRFHQLFHEPAATAGKGMHFGHAALEEGIPAVGATLGTGIAAGMSPKGKQRERK